MGIFKEIEIKIEELEDRHWNECRQISEYEMELKTYKSGYFNLLDKYLALKMMLDNQTERFENERAINEKLKKRLNSIYGMEKDISEPLND